MPIHRPWPCVLLAVLLSGGPSWADEPADPDPTRFADAIGAFERADRADPPEAGGVVFAGSSSIVGWDLDASFPKLGALNRGFGGSQLSDVIYYADQVITPYRPRLVVLYAGDNDIAAGKSPERVRGDFLRLADLIRESVPDASILFLSIKPSLARWERWPTMQRANTLIKQACEQDAHLSFIDLAPPLLGDDGRPKPQLYAEDGLHLNDRGYEAWTEVLTPRLE